MHFECDYRGSVNSFNHPPENQFCIPYCLSVCVSLSMPFINKRKHESVITKLHLPKRFDWMQNDTVGVHRKLWMSQCVYSFSFTIREAIDWFYRKKLHTNQFIFISLSFGVRLSFSFDNTAWISLHAVLLTRIKVLLCYYGYFHFLIARHCCHDFSQIALKRDSVDRYAKKCIFLWKCVITLEKSKYWLFPLVCRTAKRHELNFPSWFSI